MMIAESSLAAWDKACRPTGIRWYLYKETLLCAECYHRFPETLSCAQIAVHGEDMALIAEKVFPALPDGWRLDFDKYTNKTRMLTFTCDEASVLEVHVLYGADGEQELSELRKKVKKLFREEKKLESWNGIGEHMPLYSATAGRPIRRKLRSLSESNYAQIMSLAASSCRNAALYSDVLTNKTRVMLPGELFAGTEMIACGEREYPAFSGYRAYLAEVYGDYENIDDDIGCGLTAEEKQELKAHQDHCFEALKFLEEISREYGLKYYLLAGSVLGCVRHGGFIPWDDDIDIGIRVEELERFEEVVREELPKRMREGYALMQSGADNPYPRMFSKICFEGRCCIDLWPLVPTYTDGIKAKYQWAFAKIITKVHYKKIGHKVTRFVKIVNILDKLFSDKQVMRMARRNERRHVKRETPAYINIYSIYRREKETILRQWLDTETTATFNGLQVPVVGCTDAYLTHLYGDYMAFPAPWKRASRHSDRFGVQE